MYIFCFYAVSFFKENFPCTKDYIFRFYIIYIYMYLIYKKLFFRDIFYFLSLKYFIKLYEKFSHSIFHEYLYKTNIFPRCN